MAMRIKNEKIREQTCIYLRSRLLTKADFIEVNPIISIQSTRKTNVFFFKLILFCINVLVFKNLFCALKFWKPKMKRLLSSVFPFHYFLKSSNEIVVTRFKPSICMTLLNLRTGSLCSIVDFAPPLILSFEIIMLKTNFLSIELLLIHLSHW